MSKYCVCLLKPLTIIVSMDWRFEVILISAGCGWAYAFSFLSGRCRYAGSLLFSQAGENWQMLAYWRLLPSPVQTALLCGKKLSHSMSDSWATTAVRHALKHQLMAWRWWLDKLNLIKKNSHTVYILLQYLQQKLIKHKLGIFWSEICSLSILYILSFIQRKWRQKKQS